ncbi:MAG: hypothetical protein ACREE4_23535 [Stellaceae bacterium]
MMSRFFTWQIRAFLSQMLPIFKEICAALTADGECQAQRPALAGEGVAGLYNRGIRRINGLEFALSDFFTPVSPSDRAILLSD